MQIIIFGNKERLKLMEDKDFIEFFIDVTFDIVPKKHSPYKLMTIASVDYKTQKTISICSVLL